MSGLLPSRTGVYDNAAEFRSSVPTFAHYLRLEGYRTCLSGKMHFVGPDQLHGFEERLTTDIYPADFGWTPDWSKPQERIDWWYHNMTSVKQAGIAEITNQLEYDDEVAFLARRRLFDFARYRDQLPFCLTVSLHPPARPLRRPRANYWNLYRDEDIDLPATRPFPMRRWTRTAAGCTTCPPWTTTTSTRGRHPQLPARLLRQPLLCRRSRRRSLMETLRTCGLADDTIVMLTSDHGDFLGERGLWYKMSYPRARGAGAADRARARPLRAPARVDAVLHRGPAADARRHREAGRHPLRWPAPVDGRSLAPLLDGRARRTRRRRRSANTSPRACMRRCTWCGRATGSSSPARRTPTSSSISRPTRTRTATSRREPEHAARVAGFQAMLAARFDVAAIKADVLASQKSRLTLFRALTKGHVFPWDFQPLRDASEQYTRNHRDVTETDILSRFPPAPEARKKPGR